MTANVGGADGQMRVTNDGTGSEAGIGPAWDERQQPACRRRSLLLGRLPLNLQLDLKRPYSHIPPLQAPWRTRKIDTRISPCHTRRCACAVAKELASLCREQRAEKSRTGRSGLQPWPPRGTRTMRLFPACTGGSPNENAQLRAVGRLYMVALRNVNDSCGLVRIQWCKRLPFRGRQFVKNRALPTLRRKLHRFRIPSQRHLVR